MSFLQPKAAKSTSSSSSQNTNNALITGDYSGQVGQGTAANTALSALAGTDTNSADVASAQTGYKNYLSTAGYQPAMTALSQNLTGQGAASGLLNSGSTTKALANYGSQLNNQFYTNYLSQLQGLSSSGVAAGGLIANTGQTSQSSGTSTGASQSTLGGIASTIGGIASIFSDRRLKTDIREIKRDADGLGWYDFRYTFQPGTVQHGVMADEVEKIRPWALGPKVRGYATVNYGAL